MTDRLALAVVAVIGLSTLVPPSRAPSAPPMRQYYVTTATFRGNEAPAACATGYHFASFFEISELTNLRYNSTLGATSPDAGSGPPTWVPATPGVDRTVRGWVRTGSAGGEPSKCKEGGGSLYGSPGLANCNNWTAGSTNDGYCGTFALLPAQWIPPSNPLPPQWQVGAFRCSVPDINRVWCVED